MEECFAAGPMRGKLSNAPSQNTAIIPARFGVRQRRSPQPQHTTDPEDRHVVRRALTDRTATSRALAQELGCLVQQSVSARTIRRRLQQRGLVARRPLLRLPLTLHHRRMRLQWCVERRTWTTEWHDIIFSDESRFCLQHHDGRIRVWRHRGERL
ncbi:hypothetical protein JGG83_23035 [Salmonella enterica subsp. enterica serovar Derby]|nr:hypothetical protein [Salmonella enterica subsp. enterica serovar Derby]